MISRLSRLRAASRADWWRSARSTTARCDARCQGTRRFARTKLGSASSEVVVIRRPRRREPAKPLAAARGTMSRETALLASPPANGAKRGHERWGRCPAPTPVDQPSPRPSGVALAHPHGPRAAGAARRHPIGPLTGCGPGTPLQPARIPSAGCRSATAARPADDEGPTGLGRPRPSTSGCRQCRRGQPDARGEKRVPERAFSDA